MKQDTDGEDKSRILFGLVRLAELAGKTTEVASLASDLRGLEVSLGHRKEAAIAAGFVADARRAQGKLDEALEILKQVLPDHTTHGTTWSQAFCKKQIAGLLAAKADFDRALEILAEVRQSYASPADDRFLADCVRQIAAVLEAKGDLAGAISAREQELVVLQRVGDTYAGEVCRTRIEALRSVTGEIKECTFDFTWVIEALRRYRGKDAGARRDCSYLLSEAAESAKRFVGAEASLKFWGFEQIGEILKALEEAAERLDLIERSHERFG